MSPFPNPNGGWLKNAEAAELLAVDERTIKRWMRNPATREALCGVRHRSQYRIPRPDNISFWELQTRARLKRIGIHPQERWQRELEELGRQGDRFLLESFRLWIAAFAKAIEGGPCSADVLGRLRKMWEWACALLEHLPRQEMEVVSLKNKVPEHLLAYWPGEKHFALVQRAHTLKALEEIRQPLDFANAAVCLKENGRSITGENLRPLVHNDIYEHINDVAEPLPPDLTFTLTLPEPTPCGNELESEPELQAHSVLRVIKRRDSLRRTVYTVEAPPGHLAFCDMRQRRVSLSLRFFRDRYPLRKAPQCDIIAHVEGARERPPGSG